MEIESDYLHSIKEQFQFYKSLGDKTFDQLEEKDFFWQFNEESNSIAIIVNHLWGNFKSRWTDFLSTDGEKEWRDRDREFEVVIKIKKEMLDKWNDGWECLFTSLNSLNKDNFSTTIYIRNETHTMVEAINRQLAHCAYHLGQIVYIGKMAKGNTWTSLSIPKGKSTEFNIKKFSRGKH